MTVRVRRALTRLVPLILVAALVGGGGGAVIGESAAHADDPDSPISTIEDGSLTWGVKASWRSYAGSGTLTDGVTQEDTGKRGGGPYVFPITSGSYDATLGETTVRASGSIHWQSHYYPDEKDAIGDGFPPPGYTGPTDIYILDVTLANPEVTITADGAQITAEMTSRSASTWQMVNYGRIPVASLVNAGVTPTVESGSTTWTTVPTVASDPGILYSKGTALDPVTISYTGSGGAPVVSESWTPPGTVGMNLDANDVWGVQKTGPVVMWVDQARGFLHTRTQTADRKYLEIRAYDPTKLEWLGETLLLDYKEGRYLTNPAFVDADTGKIFYSSNGGKSIDRYLQWDASALSYSVHTIPGFTSAGHSLLWDSVRKQAFTITQRENVWYAHRYTMKSDYSFSEEQYELPAGPEGYFDWYNLNSGVVLSDGSLLLRRSALTADGSRPPGLLVQRVSIAEGVARVTEIPGTDLREYEGKSDGHTYNSIRVGAEGSIYLIEASGRPFPSTIQQLRLGEDGAIKAVGEPLATPESSPTSFSVDPEDGTLWGINGFDRRMVAIRNGSVVANFYTKYLNRAKEYIAIGPEHAIYVLSSDGEERATSDGVVYGYARFTRIGVSPVVIRQPSDVTVYLEGGSPKDVMFTVESTGTPGPTIQWQSKLIGALKFSDLEGQTGGSLSVQASAASTGMEYRAVITNAAGSIATEPATLTVLSAPSISQQPIGKTVQPGEDATFQVLASGNPEPTIHWEQYLDDKWVAVSGAKFDVDGGNLTVRDSQEAAQFRAKVSNSQGTVYSSVASLMVELPTGGENGEIIGLPNSTGARTTVTPGIEVSNEGMVRVSGSGFVKGTNKAGAYLLFGYVTKFPSAEGSVGVGYDYIPGQDNQRYVAWPDSETAGSANGVFDDSGAFDVTGLVVESSFTATSGANVDCLDSSVQCGVLTIGAHGGRDANLETFTPVYFKGQSPNVTKKAPVISSSPASASVVEGTNVNFSAGATGWPIPTVQWQSKLSGAGDWVDIPDATTSTYHVAEVSLGASGTQYRAMFSNSEGTAVTDAASLTVVKRAVQKPIVDESGSVEGSLTWGVKASFRSYITGPIAKGAISVSNGASTQGGVFWFGQRSTQWSAQSGTGSTSYGGAVRFTGHSGLLDLTFSDPVVQIDSAESGTLLVSVNGSQLPVGSLNLAAAGMSKAEGGVSYSNVPVRLTSAGARLFSYGSSQFYPPGTAMDPLSFVVGQTSTSTPGGDTGAVAAYNSASWTAPAAPPANSGVWIDPEQLKKLRPGSEITAIAEGFEPNESDIKVVLYSNPVVLEQNLVASANGTATWTGIIPLDVEPGVHTLTIQGSVNRGIEITVLDAAPLAGCPVTGASLDWGFKESFRSYISGSIANGEWQTSGGASYATPTFGWAGSEGAFDAELFTGRVSFPGTIRFTGHDGLLETSVANPTLLFTGPNTAYLLLDVAGVTMEDALAGKTDAVKSFDQVPFVELDLSAGKVAVSENGTQITVTGVPTAITSQGYEAFPNYEAGTKFDSIDFTITTKTGCTLAPLDANEALADELTVDPISAQGPDLTWLWWTGGGLLTAAFIGGMAIWLIRRSRDDSTMDEQDEVTRVDDLLGGGR